jgi:hypothetical protein
MFIEAYELVLPKAGLSLNGQCERLPMASIPLVETKPPKLHVEALGRKTAEHEPPMAALSVGFPACRGYPSTNCSKALVL